MKLERLEMLNLVSTKNVIVNEVVNGLEDKPYHNKFELEINLALVLFTLLGNTEMHAEMAKEDIDWIGFVNENFKLIEELKKGEYKEAYEEIFNEILIGAKRKEEFDKSVVGVLSHLGEVFTEENLAKMKEAIESVNKEEEK